MLDGLDDALRRGCAHGEALSRCFYGLVMVARNGRPPLEHGSRKRPFHRHDGVQRHGERLHDVVFRVARRGNVDQRLPAVHEIEELYAPADAEHRQLPLVCRVEQAGLKFIPRIGDALCLALVAFVIRAERRVDVPAAREKHAVENIPVVKGVGQNHSRRARAVQRVAVGVMQVVMVPHVFFRRVAFIAGHADERSLIHKYCTPVSFSVFYAFLAFASSVSQTNGSGQPIYSGWNWKQRMRPFSCSMASMTPSGEVALTVKPFPGVFTAW